MELTESITSVEAADEYGKRVALTLVERGAGAILDEINAKRPVASET